jgi:hypothetical protein
VRQLKRSNFIWHRCSFWVLGPTEPALCHCCPSLAFPISVPAQVGARPIDHDRDPLGFRTSMASFLRMPGGSWDTEEDLPVSSALGPGIPLKNHDILPSRSTESRQGETEIHYEVLSFLSRHAGLKYSDRHGRFCQTGRNCHPIISCIDSENQNGARV